MSAMSCPAPSGPSPGRRVDADLAGLLGLLLVVVAAFGATTDNFLSASTLTSMPRLFGPADRLQHRAARFSGVLIRRVLARFNSVRVGRGESCLLIAVLACILGRVGPFGGFGRVLPVAVALVIL